MKFYLLRLISVSNQLIVTSLTYPPQDTEIGIDGDLIYANDSSSSTRASDAYFELLKDVPVDKRAPFFNLVQQMVALDQVQASLLFSVLLMIEVVLHVLLKIIGYSEAVKVGQLYSCFISIHSVFDELYKSHT